MKADLTIYQGDDTDFAGQTNRWTLPTGNDYSKYSARYSVGPIVKDATIESENVADGVRYFVAFKLTSSETAALAPGNYRAALKLFDADGLCRTVDASIVIKILPQEVNNDGV